MMKTKTFFIILISALAIVCFLNFNATASEYKIGGNECFYDNSMGIKSIIPPVFTAAKDGKDFCVETYVATYCFNFSDVSLLFDRNVKNSPVLASCGDKHLLIFKNRAQFYFYAPGMFHKKIKEFKK